MLGLEIGHAPIVMTGRLREKGDTFGCDTVNI